MDCVELEELCSKALNKINLKLKQVKDKYGHVLYWYVGRSKKNPYAKFNFIDTECNGIKCGNIATSIGEVANKLFNLYEKEHSLPWWDIFYYVDQYGNNHRIKNVFAGKSLEEACIMVDLL